MKATMAHAAVSFSVKGQIVIPLRLRREFEIEEGTRALVQSTPQGILIKPVTRQSIARLRGILKRQPGAKTLAEEWAAHKRDEKALEEAAYVRHRAG